ncbi:MAG TPA: hypothetical protein PLH43_11950 [Acetivibrio sp.]|uniref:hypothetical protein n=1 Tax=Acetivibrio sp. TaxID=1872092 RepID=UPI002CF0AAD7|nr:hypothetical protein [Acetivibrio sp.]HOM03518.1 hypothetical protein [Acetivibrio sp.]
MTYDERMEKHQEMREKLMTEEDIKLTDRYMDWFKSSWQDKESRGLFDKWELADLYWEGDVNLPESDDDPGSNTNIINPNIEGQVALTVEHNISILANPREPSDVPFAEHAQIIGQFIIDKNKMRKKLEVFARRRKKFGLGIISVMWNPKALDKMGLPEFKCWNPAYVFFDPNITDVYDIQSGRFVIAVCNKSIFWAEETFGEDKATAILPAYHPMESEWLFGEESSEHDDITRDNYMHMFVFTKKKGKIRLIQMSSCGIKLWDSEEHSSIVFPKDIYPFFICPDMAREGTTYAKSTAELLFHIQDLINDLDDQIRINARLTGNIQKVVGTASGIDIDKWTNEPGLNIPAADPAAWQMVKPPEMPNYIFERRNQALYNERQIISRFSDQLTGIRQRGVDTATEALALQQSGLAGIDHDKAMIEETLGEALEYALELAKENWTEEQAFRITNKRNTFLWYNPSKLKKVPRLIPVSEEYRQQWLSINPDLPVPEYMQAMDKDENGNEVPATKNATFDIIVSIGAGIPNNKAFRYNAVKETFVNGAMDIQEYRQRIRELGVLPETSWEQEQEKIKKLEQLQMLRATRGRDIAGLDIPEGEGQNYDIEGLTVKGAPAALAEMKGELLNGNSPKSTV